MLNDLYNKQILGFAADIPLIGRLEDPDGTAKAHSKLCGSTVTVDLKVADGVVTDFAHQVKACALGQASSSIMARHVVGESAARLRKLRDEMHAMLKEGAPAPDSDWADLQVLGPVRDFKARHASTLLTFDAVVSALDMAESAAAEGTGADEKSAAQA
ncbi:iron-sulfur cluster assembly scaffold protein [Tepidamorphus sp. 3E244]|uniref:iron-sulfur cluster assembly scaffold protein n=1 Tax=Tepidamorphus sp. 3E244 TaxID=3385498 RepID=UPI0038FCEF19